jgi:hypothetical protein
MIIVSAFVTGKITTVDYNLRARLESTRAESLTGNVTPMPNDLTVLQY